MVEGFVAVAPEIGAPAVRRTLREQIARLERQLATLPPVDPVAPRLGTPRLLSLGELERVRDRLAERVAHARAAHAQRGERQEQARLRLERMLLEPGRHRFERVAAAELGEGGCGVYAVRPRLGLVGMLAGWWQVKLSSGCPLAV